MPQPKHHRSKVDEWVRAQQGLHFCQCGCGQPIVIKSRHSEPRRGIPKYLRGHSIWSVGFVGNAGPASGSWKGGRIRHSAGYVMVHSPEHPFAGKKDRYVLEHRLVLEQHLRQTQPDSPYLIEVDGELYLRPRVIVHHIDHVKTNNDIANLQPLTQSEHLAMHNRERAAAKIPRSCI